MDEIKLQKRKCKAQNEGNNRVLIAICAELSELYMKSGQFQKAIEEFKTLAGVHKLEHNQIEYAKANRGIGEAYLGLNDYKNALEHQKIYLNIATIEKNNLEIQRAYATIGHIYLSIYLETQADPEENLNAAYKYFMRSMKVCEGLTFISKLEKADMQARLFSNLGLVKDSLGDYNKAIELFTTSINICKSNDIYEQLSRGYMSLAALYEKQNDSGKMMHQYNLAIEAAKKIKNNVDLMGTVLLAKSEALIKLEDFYGAKKTLYKAYKLNSPNLQDRKLIEKYLRAVATMCYTEDKLTVNINDNRELKKLYELMGDCACDVKNYSKALEYYKLMLNYAEKSGISGKELATCYNSLALTYEDNKMYQEAIECFEKEFNFRDNIKDCLDALSKIADNKEASNQSVDEVLSVYNKAIEYCRKHSNLKEERRMVTRCIQYLQRIHDEVNVFKYEQKLNNLEVPENEIDSSSSDNESDVSISNTSKENYVDLDDITDSDKSDSDLQTTNTNNVITGKRRSKNFVIKKNAKGETQLHVACINGKIPVVKHLLEQGHPVNVRDNSGWLPIHEACNHGYYEIVKLLLDKGAAINDRGGVKCDGISPIFDAANNGHLEIVELLLDRGASVTIKADNGDTTLNVLKLWHQKYPFNGEEYDFYLRLINRITDALKKVGCEVRDEVIVHETTEDSEEINFTEEVLSGDENDSDHDSDSSSVVGTDNRFQRGSSSNLLNEYQEIMKNLGKKSTKKIPQQIKPNNKEKKSALVRERELLFDDWLEDDLQPAKATKRRKTSSNEAVLTYPTKRNIDNSSPLKKLSGENKSSKVRSPSAPSPSKRRFTIDNSTQLGAKRKIQVSLLDTGVDKTTISSKSRQNPTFQRHRSLEQSSKQSKITAFGSSKSLVEIETAISPQFLKTQETAVSSIPPKISTGDLMVYVDVKIEGKVFRVPVLLSQIQDNTIGWLADQAAQKYARKECSKPCLELETTSGALLCDEDPLSLLFPLGTTQAEPVVGRIMKLFVTPLVDRYKEVCSHMKEDVNESLATLLEEVSVKLNVQNRGFSTTLSPLCKALNHQTTLLELNLSGNFLDVSCMAILCTSLPSLVNLASLNLRCTGLTSNHLTEIVKMFSTASGRILEKLKHLDLSNNYLRNKSFYHLSEIVKHLKLEELNIANVEFTSGLFKENANINLDLRDVRNLNISDNGLSTSDIEKFLSWTTFNKIVDLNLSRNCLNNVKVERWNDVHNENNMFNSLESLNLSRSKLQDSDLFELLRLCSGRYLVSIDLSYNSDLTGISLRRLLEHSTFEAINLIGCNRIFEYFPDFLDSEEAVGKRNIKLTADFDNYAAQVDNLIQYFEKIYIKPIVEKGRNLLLIYSKSIET